MLNKIHKCTICSSYLPHGCNPIVQLSATSKILIIGQAPGRKAHESGIPWNDKSGDTLRKWLNVDKDIFYDSNYFSLMPMGFCYPGKGVSGDLPPRKECAPLWHPTILQQLKDLSLILLIGQYAQQYYLPGQGRKGLTETVKQYETYFPQYFPLPHPSPRNQHWLTINPWFMNKTIPVLQEKISGLISGNM
ncbi:MAG TPA: uracil-DNA glycosylase family protein [Ferruginibacter sp.]|nr:uracil-DNA glycosylase family protein [Ferruginibacter sp.]